MTNTGKEQPDVVRIADAANLQDFAELMVDEILAKLRAEIDAGGWTIERQRDVLKALVAEQEVKRRLKEKATEGTTMPAEREAISTEGPQCPYCGCQYTADDPVYFDEMNYTSEDCQDCGETFSVEVYTETTWTTKTRESTHE